MAGKLANVETDNSGSNATLTVTPCIWTGSTCTVPQGVNAGCYAQVPKLHSPCTGVIVAATTHWQDAQRVAEASRGLGSPMISLESSKLDEEQLLAQRGW